MFSPVRSWGVLIHNIAHFTFSGSYQLDYWSHSLCCCLWLLDHPKDILDLFASGSTLSEKKESTFILISPTLAKLRSHQRKLSFGTYLNTWVYWKQLLLAEGQMSFATVNSLFLYLPAHCKPLISPIISGENLDQWLALSLAQQLGRAAALWTDSSQRWNVLCRCFLVTLFLILFLPLLKTMANCPVVCQDIQWECSCKGEQRREQRFSLQAGKQPDVAQRKKIISCLHILENSLEDN